MSQASIFADEWRECLRAQYMDVCRRDDRRTGETLTRVMLEIGFTEADLNELRLRATMRDMPADFVPDIEVMEASAVELREPSVEEAVRTRHPLPVPSTPEPEIVLVEDTILEEETLEEDTQAESPDIEDPDAPEQLSLF
jgi:hypothetical protein